MTLALSPGMAEYFQKPWVVVHLSNAGCSPKSSSNVRSRILLMPHVKRQSLTFQLKESGKGNMQRHICLPACHHFRTGKLSHLSSRQQRFTAEFLPYEALSVGTHARITFAGSTHIGPLGTRRAAHHYLLTVGAI